MWKVALAGLLLVAQSVSCLGQSTEAIGKKIFAANCQRCHGEAGNRGRFGARDLTKSNLEPAASRRMVENGKGFMPAWRDRLTSKEIDEVIQYILTLRRARLRLPE